MGNVDTSLGHDVTAMSEHVFFQTCLETDKEGNADQGVDTFGMLRKYHTPGRLRGLCRVVSSKVNEIAIDQRVRKKKTPESRWDVSGTARKKAMSIITVRRKGCSNRFSVHYVGQF
jgi:hypothetical protein